MASDIAGIGEHAEADLARLARLIEPGSLLEATPECLVVAQADGRIVFANHHVERLTAFAPRELVGQPVDLLIGTDLLAIASGTRVETTCRRRDGSLFPVEAHVGSIDGSERLLVVTLRDVTELQEGREARFEAEAKYRALVEQIPAVVYLDPIDENQDSIYVSPQVTDLLGIDPDEWLTDPYCWRNHVHPDDIDQAWAEYEEAYRDHVPLNHEYRMVHADGTVRWVLEQAYPIRDEDGNPWLIQGVIFDITARKTAEQQIAFLAYHDKLTELPNRALFEEMLDNALARARRHELSVGVLFMDLDNFKLVNDSLGHQVGDDLLRQLAARLRHCTRETDLVGRLGGDEFLMLLSDLERGTGVLSGVDAPQLVAETVAERVRSALAEPFDLNGTSFYLSASIGISLYPHDAHDAETLLRNADAAMYAAKKSDPGGYVVFTARDEDAGKRLSLATRLRQAVSDRSWVLHYQPIVDLGDGSVHSLEALVRWREPNGGLTAPGEFIPLAEEMGLIEAIGEWVFEELARQRASWHAQGVDVGIGYNLSPRQMGGTNIAERLVGMLKEHEVDPREITIEITESTAMADPERTQRVLGELHTLGFNLAIDDFGTGYSSLARLKHMPVDILKIDQAFIRHLEYERDLAGMVRAMIQLAQSLGMVPLAEGIESYGEYEFLRANGCRLAQGFLFAYPVPAEEIPEVLSRPGGLLPPAPGGASTPIHP
jgi:diguanylate cyclase (GGDEF)-like protein/PAS domain S-box-containing protein